MSFCIYGAGIVASSVYTAIKALYQKEPLFFLVSDPENKGGISEQSPEGLDGIPVKSLSAWEEELQNGTSDLVVPEYYLIATPEIHHAAIMDSLRSLEKVQPEDFRMIPITNEAENKLMDAYYRNLPGHTTVSELLDDGYQVTNKMNRRFWPSQGNNVLMHDSSVQVFQAKSHMDKQLNYQKQGGCSDNQKDCNLKHNESGQGNTKYLHMDYIYPIQVGGALTEQTIASLRDDVGDNISVKNRNYCELTATYYAWKHSLAAYKGICHYRRMFDINEEQMQALLGMGKEWDVILPYPTVHYPDISVQHTRYVAESDWNALMRALQEVAPEYWEAYKEGISAGEHYFHNFNMLIARAEVFDDYCDFLFRVLERTEELATPKGWERADRFAGYLGENLTTLYFLKNRDRWKTVYAGKIWLT